GMRIVVLSRKQAEEEPPPDVPYAHISILEPGLRTLLPVTPLRLATLFLEFDDVWVDEHGGTIPISDEQAREIVLFVLNLPPAVEVLICQCRAGISRSTATAAAAARILGLDHAWIFDHPNYS